MSHSYKILCYYTCKLYSEQVTNYLKNMGTVLYKLYTENNSPLHIQLYEAIKRDILTNHEVGNKLPSIRKLALEYNLSKTTVESAYAQLYAEGLIESKPKSGYYVADLLYTMPPSCTHVSQQMQKEQISYRYDFFPAQLTKESFPLKTWKRLFNKAIDDSLDFGSYLDGQGELGLREAITSYITALRGVKCESNQVIICSGFSDSMGLLAKLIRCQYTCFGMEEPGYHVARRVFEEYGYTIKKIAVDHTGMQLHALQNSNVKLIYITPSHHYPTGATMPISNRLKLLKHMHHMGGLVIEDDYDSELAYYNRPIPSLQGLDTHDSVVYLGTFAKSLSPALRVSYMVLPKHLVPRYKKSYDAHFPRVALTTQKTLELFLKEGHWERHLRKIRTLNKKKHHLLKKLLKETLHDTFEIVSEGAGLAILINPTVPFHWEKFKTLAEKERIKLYFAKERCGGNFEAIRMGFGGFNETSLKEAIEIFATIWHQSLLHHD